ncbi:MAG: ArsR/SmtB family transcription factor [Pseudomonadales bacterium]
MTEPGDQEDRVFAALADRTRRVMLDRLFAEPGLTLNELVAGLGMRRQSATRHLQVLESAGLVVVRWRGREKRHYLNPVPIAEIESRWIDKFARAPARALVGLRHALEERGEGEA